MIQAGKRLGELHVEFSPDAGIDRVIRQPFECDLAGRLRLSGRQINTSKIVSHDPEQLRIMLIASHVQGFEEVGKRSPGILTRHGGNTGIDHTAFCWLNEEDRRAVARTAVAKNVCRA